uniref:Phosphoribulokinase/uridine kinase domain-containing protein n=1 Tax=Alexandrium monilatum TaxID=311494 RepID=A0A7S4SG09_9DINO
MCTRAQGELFLYNDDIGLAAFEVGGRGPGTRALVCIPGLTDGLMSMRYLPALADAMQREGWRVVQPVLSSSYSGWGLASLEQDAEEIDRLLDFLTAERGLAEFALLGHSTGCQDIVHYLRRGRRASDVIAAILQAPVSDREALLAGSDEGAASAAELAGHREAAAALIAAGRGEEPMPRAAALLLGPPHVVTASRFASLTGRMTADDMFSSDLSDDELRERLGHIAVPTLVAVSADDEYVPEFVDSRALAGRMADAMAASVLGRVQRLVVEEGGHGLRRGGGAAAFVEATAAFLQGLDSGPRLSWESELARGLREQAKEMPEGRPLMVALAGMPGSGKTTAAHAIERLLGPSCLVVPMDGFHLPMVALRARHDAADAIYRRGAPDTFDPASLRECLRQIRSPEGPCELTLPGFDHAAGDPTPGGVRFERQRHRIVLVEGLYLLHDADGWEGTAEAFDRTVYLEADVEECISRVKERNKVIPGYTPEEIELRTEEVDRANAVTVQCGAHRADTRSRWNPLNPTDGS